MRLRISAGAVPGDWPGLRVEMCNRPPFGMASSELLERLRMTCTIFRSVRGNPGCGRLRRKCNFGSGSSDAPERIINKSAGDAGEGIKILRLPHVSFKIGLFLFKNRASKTLAGNCHKECR
jgi:hypothetical protein